jgi:HEPN domain-containing protein
MNKQKLVLNWVKKARADLKVAEDELKTIDPEINVTGFLLQQFVEKYLKAFLVENEKKFEKSHSIEYLLSICKELDKNFEKFYTEDFITLTQCSVDARYPDVYFEIDKEYIDKVIGQVYELKKLVEKKLGIVKD